MWTQAQMVVYQRHMISRALSLGLVAQWEANRDVFVPTHVVTQLTLDMWGEALAKSRRVVIRDWRAAMRHEIRYGWRPPGFDSVEMEVVRRAANAMAKKCAPTSWDRVRMEIGERDAWTCQVCLLPLEEGFYECGHIKDRCLGGTDVHTNLVAMCWGCNQTKPSTWTPNDYREWVILRRRKLYILALARDGSGETLYSLLCELADLERIEASIQDRAYAAHLAALGVARKGA